jgi:hypothetical protein
MANDISTIRQRLELKLSPFTRKFCVSYALDIALSVCTDPKDLELLDNTAKWLRDELSTEELKVLADKHYATYATYATATYATATATAAAATAYATAYATASAAYATAYAAAYATAYATATYACASSSATYAAANHKVDKLLEYEKVLDDKINNLTKLEKLIYGV